MFYPRFLSRIAQLGISRRIAIRILLDTIHTNLWALQRRSGLHPSPSPSHSRPEDFVPALEQHCQARIKHRYLPPSVWAGSGGREIIYVGRILNKTV
jgi:hypothetical protein